jgi:hypothetical protein
MRAGIDRASRWPDHRAGMEVLSVADSNTNRSINRMAMIAFILAFIAGLLAIII